MNASRGAARSADLECLFVGAPRLIQVAAGEGELALTEVCVADGER